MALYPCGSSNGGGGGSTVVPNPTGEAVGELTSIGIDGNKYSISGGGGAYTTTVLFTNGASGDTTFQLSSAYTNFDAIAIYYSHFDGQDSYEDVRTYPTTFLNSVSSTDEVLGFTNDVWYYYFSVYSTTEFRYVKSNAGYITDIIGIKYGSNSGGGAVTGVKGSAESTYRTGNVDISAANIGLGNVDNTSDLNKPISTATQTALNGKVDTIAGKGLSTNDYDNTAKGIVDGVTSALAGKADASSVPTKTSDLINDSGFITNLVNNLLNYYLKTETYSKTEVDTLLQAITTLDIQAVAQLPTTNISTTTIYLVPKQDAQIPDVKDEYINLDGTTSGWELIGNTQIDLSNYVTTSDLTTALQSYTTKAYVDGLIGDLSSATTTDKSSVVAMVNELNSSYEGVDLTVKFANEISSYSNEWEWIQARLDGHNVRDLHVGDYIPINIAANGGIAAETHKAEIAGINTYRRTGDGGHEVGYHIDWITRDCYSQTVQFNTTNINNGNATNANPFLASNLKSWLDGTLYPLLDAKLKNVIKAKRILAPSRYQSGATLTDDNSWAWQDFDKLWVPLETEIFDCLVWSTKGFGNGQAVQYPIFANSYEHRMKGVGPGGARALWWTASALSGNSASVVDVDNGGYSSSHGASDAFGVPVCFRTMEA